jgi:hypothetical protein
MITKPYRILVFEDDNENYKKIAEPLKSLVDEDTYSIQRFDGSIAPPEDTETSDKFVSLVKEKIRSPKYAALVVLDWDLTMYRNGVSRTHVQRACQELGVPLCAYHRDEGLYSNPDELQDYEEDIIKIDKKEGDQAAAEAFATIAQGFSTIYEALSEPEELQPKSMLYDILGAPSVAESKLDQYSLGQSGTIGIAKSAESDEDRIRRMATFFGYWVHNQLLEYPGVLLNYVSAASYLGIDPQQFRENNTIQETFSDAQYEGPFSDLGQWWWAPLVDEVQAEHMEPGDGQLIKGEPLFERIGVEDFTHVQCTMGHKGAGYYCIMREEPVCEDHSVQPSNWIPMGATHSRITEEDYDKLSSWMFD